MASPASAPVKKPTSLGLPVRIFSIINQVTAAKAAACTTKALSYMSAAKVQVTELSEPIFAALMAWVFIHEQPTLSFLYGAIFIISGIFLMNRAPKSN
ncbi:EamA family transporter [Klebsiella pneumoniae]